MPRKSFSQHIADLHGGKTNTDLTEELHELVGAVEMTGLKGKIVITLSASMDGDMLMLAVTSKATLPKKSRPKVMMFVKDGELYEDDPRQLILPVAVPLQAVPAEKKPKVVNLSKQHQAHTGDDDDQIH